MRDSAPERVLMTADTIGGVWTYALALVRELCARGSRVMLATMGQRMRQAQREEAESIPGLEVTESDWRLEWMDDPWEDVERAGDWLLDLERRFEPDLVHLNGYCHGGLPWRAPAIVVAHSCVLSWWRAVHGRDAPSRYDRYRREVARGLGAAGAVVAPTRAMATSIALHYGAPQRLVVIGNGRDPARFDAQRPKEPLVLSAGRLWDPAKNLAAVDEAARVLPFRMLIAGSDERPHGGRHLAQWARSLGWIDEGQLREHLARAAVYAAPARYEPFGLGILEAALSGCALVLGDLASLRELWSGAAVFVSPDDVAELARAIRELLERPADRDRLGSLARARALARTPARMTDAYVELYGSLRRVDEPRTSCA